MFKRLLDLLLGWRNPIPDSPKALLSRKDFLNILNKKYGIKPLTRYQPIDAQVRLISKSGLDKIANRIVYPSNWYVADIWDCDDYALQAQLDTGRKYGTSVRLVTGMLKNEEIGADDYHAVAATLDSDFNLWWLEPNAGYYWAGEWHKQGEYGMIIDKVFI